MNISIGPYFGTEEILNGSSTITRPITTNTAVTPGWPELRRLNGVAYPRSQSLDLNHIPGRHIATAYFRLQLLPELEFDPDTMLKLIIYVVGTIGIHRALGLGLLGPIAPTAAARCLVSGCLLMCLSMGQIAAYSIEFGKNEASTLSCHAGSESWSPSRKLAACFIADPPSDPSSL